MATVSLENLGFTYPGADSPTLSKLNLNIPDGEAHALLGASGAGKTTLLNILSGLLTPSSGALRFDDKDVSLQSGRLRNVAQVFQFPVLYESLSVADNLAFPLRTRKAPSGMIRERLDYICSELDITDLQSLKPAALSLFQKQLIAVGKALMRPDVSLVLLDEPLTAVEPRTKWRLRQTLRRVQADLKVTMIYVTHDQTEALTFADRVSVLTAGGILQTGTPEEVYNSPEHEFVGHFVGSPGMNFLPAKALGIDDAERAGFRPEWAVLGTASSPISSSPANSSAMGQLTGQVLRIRVQGAQAGKPFGLLTLATDHGQVAVRGEFPDAPVSIGDSLNMQLTRCITFTNQRKVSDIELV
ncbi:ABC transporter ATP-binding protein [Congregibacter variabilis]|uniref:ABC transporter ATP-binding protein n=1 Tax=Congregibacter variabilis TaxID=3081200 RepID=A0ABZ0I8U9_9GAMM|nr:ABC transporter ATP-binding protein [Congregibacter sp. IMCC43200]